MYKKYLLGVGGYQFLKAFCVWQSGGDNHHDLGFDPLIRPHSISWGKRGIGGGWGVPLDCHDILIHPEVPIPHTHIIGASIVT